MGCHWVAPIVTEIMNIICPTETWKTCTNEIANHSFTANDDGTIVVDLLHKLQLRKTGFDIISK